MNYTFTAEQKQWLNDYINALPESPTKAAIRLWINTVGDSVTDSELDALSGLLPALNDFIAWLRGGIRPPHPH